MIWVSLRCDLCPAEYGDLGAETFDQARDIAEANDWRCDEHGERCPAHATVDMSLFAPHVGAF